MTTKEALSIVYNLAEDNLAPLMIRATWQAHPEYLRQERVRQLLALDIVIALHDALDSNK